MKKRFFVGLLIVILLALLTCASALADVIWTPNDKFFEEAYEDCLSNGRSYTANGKDGSITVWRDPGYEETIADVNNGSTFFVSFTYTDQSGEKWGVVEFDLDDAGNAKPEYTYQGKTGWVHMTDLQLIYDYISFDSDHQSEFKPYTGTYDEFKASDKIVFWTYPGSGVIANEVDATKINDRFAISKTYTDDENRLWGFVEYNFGIRHVWVCISAPSGAGMELASADSAAPTDSAAPSVPGETLTVRKDQTPTIILIAAIVAAVIIVTAILIAVFWKKTKKKDAAVK